VADRNLNAYLPKVAIKDPNENRISIAYGAEENSGMKSGHSKGDARA
jgi:hypothetical protein